MSRALILGNGPSRSKGLAVRAGATVYACNLVAVADNLQPDYLYCVDPWGQFDIVSTKYSGAMRFLDFDPIPAELPVDTIIYEQIPQDYEIKIHNPEHQAEAESWVFYCTGNTMNIYWNERMKHNPDYWQPRRAYILYVPAGLNITQILPRMEATEHEQTAPSGAYALQGAIMDGHTDIDVYGFDSIAGIYATDSRAELHADEEEERRGAHFRFYYDKIMAENDGVNITWHT